MPLSRKISLLTQDERIELDVWDVATKKIIFTGTSMEVGNYLGVQQVRVRDALKKKYKLLRKYAIRTKKSEK